MVIVNSECWFSDSPVWWWGTGVEPVDPSVYSPGCWTDESQSINHWQRVLFLNKLLLHLSWLVNIRETDHRIWVFNHYSAGIKDGLLMILLTYFSYASVNLAINNWQSLRNVGYMGELRRPVHIQTDGNENMAEVMGQTNLESSVSSGFYCLIQWMGVYVRSMSYTDGNVPVWGGAESQFPSLNGPQAAKNDLMRST